MAKIIKKGKILEKELASYKKAAKKNNLRALFAFVISIFSVAGYFHTQRIIFLLAALILGITAIGLLLSIAPIKKEIDILRAGIDGENLANRCIALLPEAYTAFRNLTVTYRDKSSEIDMLIVGPTGVFVVETKNLNGSIRGNINDTRWTQHKIGRGGTPYSKIFYNPIKQVNTHVYRVANYLRENGVSAYINAAVYFSNVNTSVEIFGSDEKTPLFSASDDGANQMLHYIINNNQQLTTEQYKKIIDLFKNI